MEVCTERRCEPRKKSMPLGKRHPGSKLGSGLCGWASQFLSLCREGGDEVRSARRLKGQRVMGPSLAGCSRVNQALFLSSSGLCVFG